MFLKLLFAGFLLRFGRLYVISLLFFQLAPSFPSGVPQLKTGVQFTGAQPRLFLRQHLFRLCNPYVM